MVSATVAHRKRRKRAFRRVPEGWTDAEVRAFHVDKLECFRIIADRSKPMEPK